MRYKIPEGTNADFQLDRIAQANAIVRDFRSFQSGDPLNDWMKGTKASTGLRAQVFFVAGFLVAASLFIGLGLAVTKLAKSSVSSQGVSSPE